MTAKMTAAQVESILLPKLQGFKQQAAHVKAEHARARQAIIDHPMTSDLAKRGKLANDGLVPWWAGEHRFWLEGQAVLRDATLRPVDHAALLRDLLTARVLPAAAAVSADARVSELLHQVFEQSAPEDVPSIDVLIDPLAVATTIAHRTPQGTDDRRREGRTQDPHRQQQGMGRR